MALASFDGDFSFSQEPGPDTQFSPCLPCLLPQKFPFCETGEQQYGTQTFAKRTKQLKQSKAFQAQLRLEELLKEYSEERDKKRVTLDQSFTPDDADFSAAKAYDYDRSTNYYEILGIDEYAPLDEVNRAYKRLSLVYHPDKTKGMSAQQQEDYETIFISVKNAHLVLGDQPTRRQYDKDRDQDRAKEVVSGVKAPSSQHVDLTEVLKRISEMQRPPGKVVEVALELELEQFFYGTHKAVSRERRIKDFYAGMINQEHVYRFHVPRGAPDPWELTFKEQGDHNPDTRPDTVKFRITARPHAVVTRQEGDLLRSEAGTETDLVLPFFHAEWLEYLSAPRPVEREQRLQQEIQLSAGSLAEAGDMCGIEDSGKRENNLVQKRRGLLHCSSACTSRAQALD
ncbi:ERDJ3B [Symbiodinium sp. CCMP2456]|nr:ERDJ3B [Symbiodinium sp. CCMP2456]